MSGRPPERRAGRDALKTILVFGLLVGFVTAGCGKTGLLESNRQLQITVSADRVEALVDTEFAFRVDATGNGLFQVTLVFGDGNESVSPLSQIAGATRVGLTIRHAYATAGTYRVVATAEELSGNKVSRSLDVVVK